MYCEKTRAWGLLVYHSSTVKSEDFKTNYIT